MCHVQRGALAAANFRSTPARRHRAATAPPSRRHHASVMQPPPRTALAPRRRPGPSPATFQLGTTRVSLSTMVPSVRILALEVCFEVRNDAKMIPSILRCFPEC